MSQKNNVIARFACATEDVLKLMLDLEAVASPTKEGDSGADSDGVTVAIGLTGDVSGETLFHFPKDTALEIVKIMSGMEIGEMDDFVTSALGEISNIISGNAATGLVEQQITCDILPPKISMEPEGRTGEGCVINTPVGKVELEVSVKE